ncbi:MAG: hypothetical protein IJM30_06105 [Thermoguttaceae bacterium]|nr:hypothetical protein [Thermoguttaceae bacterium]
MNDRKKTNDLSYEERLRADIDDFLELLPSDIGVDFFAKQSRKTRFENKSLFSIAAIVLVLLTFGIVLRYFLSTSEVPEGKGVSERLAFKTKVESDDLEIVDELDSPSESEELGDFVGLTENLIDYSAAKIGVWEENLESALVLPVSFNSISQSLVPRASEDASDDGAPETTGLESLCESLCSDESVLRFDPLVQTVGVLFFQRP